MYKLIIEYLFVGIMILILFTVCVAGCVLSVFLILNDQTISSIFLSLVFITISFLSCGFIGYDFVRQIKYEKNKMRSK